MTGPTGRRCETPSTTRTSTRSPHPTRRRGLPTYAQVVGAIDRLAIPTDYAVAAAGGLPAS